MRTLSITPSSQANTGKPRRSWEAIRRTAAEIGPETIERIAQRVAQLLADDAPLPSGPVGLIDASRLARHLGLSRAWVYEHARELGAIKVGSGPRARLRFDLATAKEALAAHDKTGPSDPAPPPAARRPRRPRRDTQAPIPLLPIHQPGRRKVFHYIRQLYSNTRSRD